jgi:hypothetical protein
LEYYAIVDLAASAPGQILLRQIEPDRMRAELIAFHALIENSSPQWNRHTDEHPVKLIGRHVLPVPLAMFRAGFDPGELVHTFDDCFWEVRLPDADSILARLDDAFPCGATCRWVSEETVDDASAVDFVLLHGEACEEADGD